MLCVSLIALAALAPVLTAQESPKKQLESSPRHHEWIQVKRGERAVHCFVSYPEVNHKALAVLVIHENKGLTDWVRSVADKLAEAGYIAIAPDLLSGKGPGGGRTDSFPSTDAATEAIYKLDPSDVAADLRAVADAALKIEACNGKLCVAGFCWGGSRSFEFAMNCEKLAASFVFYGSAPTDEDEFAYVQCPVYGFYAGSDERINAGLAATTESMKKRGKVFEPVTYESAGHGFMRMGEATDASEPNKKAMQEAWARWKKVLAAL